MMRPGELRRRPPKPRMKGEVREGLRYIRSVPILWIPMVMLAAIGILAYNFTVTLPLFVTGALQSNDATFTLLYATFSFGSVVGALVVANRGLVSIRTIVIGAALLGVCMLALGSVPGVRGAFPIMLLLGGASILYMTSTTANVQVTARPDMHGRILAHSKLADDRWYPDRRSRSRAAWPILPVRAHRFCSAESSAWVPQRSVRLRYDRGARNRSDRPAPCIAFDLRLRRERTTDMARTGFTISPGIISGQPKRCSTSVATLDEATMLSRRARNLRQHHRYPAAPGRFRRLVHLSVHRSLGRSSRGAMTSWSTCATLKKRTRLADTALIEFLDGAWDVDAIGRGRWRWWSHVSRFRTGVFLTQIFPSRERAPGAGLQRAVAAWASSPPSYLPGHTLASAAARVRSA